MYDIRLRYRFNFIPDTDSRWMLKGSIGLSFNYVSTTLKADTGQTASTDDFTVLPFIGIYGGVRLGEKWAIEGEVDWIELSGDSFIDTSIWVRWQFGAQWDLRLGYRYIDRLIDAKNMRSVLEQNRVYLGIGFDW